MDCIVLMPKWGSSPSQVLMWPVGHRSKDGKGENRTLLRQRGPLDFLMDSYKMPGLFLDQLGGIMTLTFLDKYFSLPPATKFEADQ